MGASAPPGGTITAAICSCDRGELLEHAIASLLAQDFDPRRRTLLVIDNSRDGESAEEARRRHRDTPGLTYLVAPPRGLSYARNLALDHCGTDYIAFLDDDAVARPGWLGAIVAGFDHFGERAGIVGGRTLPIWESPRPDWLSDAQLGMLSIVDWGGGLRIAGEGEWVAGANIAFRTKPLEEIGGFPLHLGRMANRHILLGNEEVFVIEALAARGFDVVYAPDAEVDHLIPADRLTRSWFRRRAAWQAVSDFLADPQKAVEAGPRCWRALNQEAGDEPGILAGLVASARNGDELGDQGDRIYQLVTALLAGAEPPE